MFVKKRHGGGVKAGDLVAGDGYVLDVIGGVFRVDIVEIPPMSAGHKTPRKAFANLLVSA